MKRTRDSNEGTSLPRKLTAIGTAGEKGQLFTVYERNWQCSSCRQENYPAMIRCLRCKKTKPAGSGHDYYQDPALVALQAGERISWQETIDPATNQIYYYKQDTGETQWNRPAEMGETPLATGWFGRGKAGSSAASKFEESNSQYLLHPARKQKDAVDPRSFHIEGANEYNIWYDKYDGDIKDKSFLREAAEDRCVMQTDAGYTKADLSKEKRFFCLHFARGMCSKGSECLYYHRTPVPSDNANFEETCDCFGRQKHSTHRDDMNGIGSFMNPCRTLFVGNLVRSKYLPPHPRTLEESLWSHFGEWGELESLNLIHKLSIAFPRYRLRASAEFAKEAMTCQTLDHNEVLSIRWAKDDPNPVAQEAIKEADKDAVAALMKAKNISIEPINATNYDPNQQIMTTKITEYPNTDEQYATSTGSSIGSYYPEFNVNNNTESYPNNFTDNYLDSSGNILPSYDLKQNEDVSDSTVESIPAVSLLDDIQNKKKLLASIGIGLYDDEVEVNDSLKENFNENVDTEVHEEGVWTTHIDPNSGAMFYYNSITGESSWGTIRK